MGYWDERSRLLILTYHYSLYRFRYDTYSRLLFNLGEHIGGSDFAFVFCVVLLSLSYVDVVGDLFLRFCCLSC